jgi:hypothetical protein
VWGDRAATANRASAKYTLTGFAVNSAEGVFWAAIFEKLFGELVERKGAEKKGLARALLSGVAIARLAYVTDYYLVPRRFTPGFEKRLSNRSLTAIYAVLALTLRQLFTIT